jgi:hypothetical protein
MAILGEGHLRHQGKMRGNLLGGPHRLHQLRERRESLQDQEIHPGFGQGGDLLPESLAGFHRLHPAQRGQGNPKGPYRAGDPHRAAGVRRSLTGQLHPRAVEAGHLILQTVLRQPVTVRPEGVGLQDLRPGLQIQPMNLSDDLRGFHVQRFIAAIKGEAPGVEHRAHRPIGQHRTPGQTLQQRRFGCHRSSLPGERDLGSSPPAI